MIVMKFLIFHHWSWMWKSFYCFTGADFTDIPLTNVRKVGLINKCEQDFKFAEWLDTNSGQRIELLQSPLTLIFPVFPLKIARDAYGSQGNSFWPSALSDSLEDGYRPLRFLHLSFHQTKAWKNSGYMKVVLNSPLEISLWGTLVVGQTTVYPTGRAPWRAC